MEVKKKAQLAIIRWADQYPVLTAVIVLDVIFGLIVAFIVWSWISQCELRTDARLARIESHLIYLQRPQNHP